MAGQVSGPKGMNAEAKVLLEKVSRLDREISRSLGKLSVSGRLPEGAQAARPFEGYRAQLHQLRIQASHLDRSQQAKVRKAIREAMKKTELLNRTVRNEKLRAADKKREMRRHGLAPAKPAKKPAAVQAAPALAPTNDLCANAQLVTEGSYSGSTIGATNDGSESCVGEPSEDIWYSYTATTTAVIKVDTLGSDFDTVLSVHTPPCPGTFDNEITCNDDCINVDSCVTFPAVAGTTYMIRVGGYSTGDTGSVQLHIGQVGTISGTVTASDTSLPLQDVYLEIYNSSGSYAGYGYTDSTGQYTSEGLSADTYFIIAYGSSGYLDKLYDNFPCDGGNCDVLTGTPVTVAAGANTPGINFALDPGGSIAGQITDATSGHPIPYAGVEIYDESGSYAAYGYTDETGTYKADGLITGTYFVRTSAYGDYLDELYDNIPCTPYCDETTGTPVAVTQGQTTSGISFALEHLGHIAGRVTDEATGAGIANVEVDIMSETGSWMGGGYTDSSGNYTATRLPTGNYYAVAYDYNSGHIGELYDNISCPNGNCDMFTGTPIHVQTGGTTSGINFALVHGGTIVGRVLGAGGLPLGGARVTIYDVNADSVSGDYADGSGYYAASGLTTGTYYVSANADGYLDEVYNDFPCPNYSCSPLAGDPVDVTLGQIVTGISFTLTRAGSISGVVTESATHNVVPYAEIDIYDASGEWMGYGYSDEQGKYTAGGLFTGNYFATVSTYGDFIDELYNNIPCPYGNCDVTGGTPIPVTLSQDTPGIDFELGIGGSISGAISDSSTGDPLPYYSVYIYDSNGNSEAYGYTDESGAYTATGIPTGNHFALTSTYGDYVDELYDNIPCPRYQCNPATGTPIPVTAGQGTPGINFALSHGGSIAGVITDAATTLPLQDAWVSIFNSDGNSISYGYTDASGSYSAGGLATGSYYVLAGAYTHLMQLYDNLPCLWGECDITTGTPVAVVMEQTTGGIDFALGQGASISGTVTDAATHLPLPDAYVRVVDSSWHYAQSYTDGLGQFTITNLPAGVYFAAADGWQYAAQLYQGIPCPNFNCDWTSGTPITVNDSGDTPGIDFALQLLGPTGSIHGTVTRDSNGAPINDAYVEIYDSTGSQVDYGYTDSTGSYTLDWLQPGTYYAFAHGYGYVQEIYNNLPCPGSNCDVLTGTPIPVISGAQTDNIDFSLATAGSIRGVLWDAQSGAPLTYVVVKVLNLNGDVVATDYTNYQGQYTVSGLPSGSYYVETAVGEGYEDQLYKDVPCPDGLCALGSGTLVPVVAGTSANGINFALEKDECLYCDDFDDGELNPEWTYVKPSWSESNGDLVGSPSGKKAIAMADPAFPGCSTCTIDVMVSMSSGAGKVWIEGWHSGKSAMELLMNEQKGKWILKERVAGTLVQKAKGMKAIDPDTPVHVRMAFDGMKVQVFVGDMTAPLITMTPSAPISGTVCLSVKDSVASFSYLQIH